VGKGMKLFPRADQNAIRSGRMTLSFRIWDKCNLIKDKKYFVDSIGNIHINEIDQIVISEISEKDAEKAGFCSVERLLSSLKKRKADLDPEKDKCFRIKFQYIDTSRNAKQDRSLPSKMLDKIDERLKKMDRRAQGITFSSILRELAKQRCYNIGNLADILEREHNEIRRKLYKLNSEKFVSIDRKKRFYITSRGRQIVEHREAKLAELRK
jgi:hypothetical protein